MLRFTTWLARSGTIAANSLQPYFSAINKFFRDHLKGLVALGSLLMDARRGLATQQQPITDPDISVPILVPIVQQMLLFAHRHYRALTWQPNNLVQIKTSARFSQSALTTAIFAARKPAYVATWTTLRSTERAVSYYYLYEKQRETNVGPRPTNRPYNSLLMQYHY
jgi:hypothetical protein